MQESIRVSQKAKEQMIWLKRQTGVQQWNVLCRWALCLSLADSATVEGVDDSADSNIDIRWDNFAGGYKDIYAALLMERARCEGLQLESKVLARYARQHIHRGLGKLSVTGAMGNIADLVRIGVHASSLNCESTDAV